MSEEKYKDMIVWLVAKLMEAEELDKSCIKELRNWKASE